jgi:hypothetical protein
MASTPYDLAFRVERTNQRVCKKELSKEDAQKFRDVRARAGLCSAEPTHRAFAPAMPRCARGSAVARNLSLFRMSGQETQMRAAGERPDKAIGRARCQWHPPKAKRQAAMAPPAARRRRLSGSRGGRAYLKHQIVSPAALAAFGLSSMFLLPEHSALFQ